MLDGTCFLGEFPGDGVRPVMSLFPEVFLEYKHLFLDWNCKKCVHACGWLDAGQRLLDLF